MKRLVDRIGSTRYLPILLGAGLAVHGSLCAQETNTPKRAERPQATTHIIVQWSSGAALRKSGFTSGAREQKATALAGVSLTHSQDIGDGLEVMQTAQSLDGAALDNAIARLQADPDVEYASPDRHRQRHALTSDPLLPDQWYLLSVQPAATRTEAAWDITHGNPATVVAVLDTGARAEHPDLAGKLLPGYDFITNALVANDGDGRDANPEDTGDWIDSTDKSQQVFSDCDIGSSSWHGTRVAGLIAAATDNMVGVAGTAWNTQVLPVRVLGKCGGYDSDIIAGMRWAAGLSVTGIPLNPTPAKVINLSLGGEGACTAAYQAAVNEVIAKGVLIVASAGNEGGPVDTPANCSGVLGVAGLRHIGTKVGFSSLGSQIGLGAPGGNCVNTGVGQPCLFSIVVPINSGQTVPETSTYTDQINSNVGTSFSAPMAAAAAALMNSVNSALTPAQSISLLKASATPFPTNTGVADCHVPANANDIQDTECACTTSTCGAGMLNIGAAVAFAVRPFGILTVTGSVVSGGTITASAVGSFASNGHSIGTYEWSVVNLTGTAPVVISPSQMETTVQIPGDSQFTLRLTITDEVGAQDVKEVALSTPATATPAPTPQPATTPAPSTGGGGGQLGWELLAGAAALSMRRRIAQLVRR